MRTPRAGRQFFSILVGLCATLCCAPTEVFAQKIPPLQFSSAGSVSPAGQAPLYRIAGYEQREEALLTPSEYRALLGPASYRQWVASRVLTIVGGVAAFAGAIALLSTLGSLAQSTDYGSRSAGGSGGNYKPYVAGFGALFAAGGGMVITGLVLSLPLPPRHRTLYVPQLQIVETAR